MPFICYVPNIFYVPMNAEKVDQNNWSSGKGATKKFTHTPEAQKAMPSTEPNGIAKAAADIFLSFSPLSPSVGSF